MAERLQINPRGVKDISRQASDWQVGYLSSLVQYMAAHQRGREPNNQDHAPLQKKNPIYRPCMGDRVGVKLLCLTASPHLTFSLSGPIAQFPLGKQLLAKGCSFHSHIDLFLVEDLHWANNLLRQGFSRQINRFLNMCDRLKAKIDRLAKKIDSLKKNTSKSPILVDTKLVHLTLEGPGRQIVDTRSTSRVPLKTLGYNASN